MGDMLENISDHKHEILFVSGVVAGLGAYKILKSEKFKKFAVDTMAKGMYVQKIAEENFQNMKNDAESICEEEKNKKQKKIFISDVKEE